MEQIRHEQLDNSLQKGKDKQSDPAQHPSLSSIICGCGIAESCLGRLPRLQVVDLIRVQCVLTLHILVTLVHYLIVSPHIRHFIAEQCVGQNEPRIQSTKDGQLAM